MCRVVVVVVVACVASEPSFQAEHLILSAEAKGARESHINQAAACAARRARSESAPRDSAERNCAGRDAQMDANVVVVAVIAS